MTLGTGIHGGLGIHGTGEAEPIGPPGTGLGTTAGMAGMAGTGIRSGTAALTTVVITTTTASGTIAESLALEAISGLTRSGAQGREFPPAAGPTAWAPPAQQSVATIPESATPLPQSGVPGPRSPRQGPPPPRWLQGPRPLPIILPQYAAQAPSVRARR